MPRYTLGAHNKTRPTQNLEICKRVDIFQERHQKIHHELQTNLLAIKYLQTVHDNHNN